jgi:hypothetical protein
MDKVDIWTPKFTYRQSLAWNELHKDIVEELLYGGAKYGGKSVFGCLWMYLECYELARIYFENQPARPVCVGWMGRKIGKHFKETTLDTWFQQIPANMFSVKDDPPVITIGNRVSIRTGGLDSREDIQKHQGAAYARVFIDQAEETTRDEIAALRTATRWRLRIGGQNIQGKLLFTANPAQCWLKEEFIQNPAANQRFIQALPKDNPYTPKEYYQTVKDAYSHKPELIEAYLNGSWETFEGANQQIKAEWLNAAKLRRRDANPVKRYLVCDPARFGDDKCVIMLIADCDIEDKVIMPYCRTTEISNRLARMSRANDDIPCVVESIGADLGAGVIDELTQLGVETLQYNPAGAPLDTKHYYNMRAEAWDIAAKCLSYGSLPNSNVTLCLSPKYADTTLINQLCSPTYQYRGEKLLIESKEDIKKRLGCSPDEGDTYVIALWAWSKIDSKEYFSNKLSQYESLEKEYASPWQV